MKFRAHNSAHKAMSSLVEDVFGMASAILQTILVAASSVLNKTENKALPPKKSGRRNHCNGNIPESPTTCKS